MPAFHHSPAYPDQASPSVSSQATISRIALTRCRLSGECEVNFFRQTRRLEAAPWLTLLYPHLNGTPTSSAAILPITLLSIAERSVTAEQGAHEQATFAMFLRVNNVVSSTSARALCAGQIHALRDARSIWPSVKNMCMRCWRTLATDARRCCEFCGRAQYCDDACRIL